MKPVDLLVIGAGPAGLAAAIRFKQKCTDASIVVIDKALEPGAHSLSGAAFDVACLDELLPGWRTAQGSFLSQMTPVVKDEMYFLFPKAAVRIPEFLVPPMMSHKKDHLMSLAQLTGWLGQSALELGVEVLNGFSAASLIWDNGVVKGVRLSDQGLDKGGKPKSNFLKGEEVLAHVTVLADGGGGVLSREYMDNVGGQLNPQVYSVGVKQVFHVPSKNFYRGRVIHTLGFPHRTDVFGGGFVYSMGQDLVAVGLVIGLDWRYADLDPQKEFEVYKSHPFIARILTDGKLVEAGAKIIPEGGFFALPRFSVPGALLVGDAAGFVNMEKIKGLQHAVFSGMAAADAVASGDLLQYGANLRERGVLREMRHAANFRAVFQAGLFAGAPLSMVQSAWPWRIAMRKDHEHMQGGKCLKRTLKLAVDHAGFAALANTAHREDELAHLKIRDAVVCARCRQVFDSPCTVFCPAGVYRLKGEKINISASNCIHCGTCAVKCPFQNIQWTPPEGGEGPHYKLM